MIQIFLNNNRSEAVFDSRLEEYNLLGLKVTSGLNKGGTAEILMPPEHPAYSLFTEYKTTVEIQRDGLALFRGRALYSVDNLLNQRKVICEGELCFLQDVVSRPYNYQGTPEEVLTEVIAVYNSQVEARKQFEMGAVTVTDPNDYISMSTENTETVMATVNKLLQRCGGYIIFTTNIDTGRRMINWYADPQYRSNQVIELGENLLDLNRSGANTALATAVLPYGAKDETTGQRITIESVNDGRDYIQDDEAVALRGFIIKPVIWEDVTIPSNLLRKARAWLETNRNILTTLQLSALDLSYVDKSIDTYQVGDKIRVISKPHKIDSDFLLTERTEDLLNPAQSTITLGKELSTLTSAQVAGSNATLELMQNIAGRLSATASKGIADAVQNTENLLTTLIEQTIENIRLEVSQQYATNDQVTDAVSTSLSVLKDEVRIEFETLRTTVDGNDAEAREQFDEIYKFISFENGSIKLGASDSAITLTIENDMIVFRKNGLQFGWWDGVDFHTGNIVVEVNERAQFGSFAFIPRTDGSLMFLKVGD